MAHDVFISYSSQDKTVALAVCANLEEAGVRCWMAPRDVMPGRQYGEEIVRAIQGSRLLVVVFSTNANVSRYVNGEIERAVHHGVPIIPFRVEDVRPSGSLEFFLGQVHWLDALTPPLDQHLQTLVGTARRFLDPAATEASLGPGTPSSSVTTSARRDRMAGPGDLESGNQRTVRSLRRLTPIQAMLGAAWGGFMVLLVLASFVARMAPPWPSRIGVVLLTGLLVSMVLPWAYKVGRTAPTSGLRRRTSLLFALGCALLLVDIFLQASFVWDVPTPAQQEVGGFLLKDGIRRLLKEDESLTLQTLLDGAEGEPTNVWEQWTVVLARVGLFSTWLGLFGCLAAAVPGLVVLSMRNLEEPQPTGSDPGLAPAGEVPATPS